MLQRPLRARDGWRVAKSNANRGGGGRPEWRDWSAEWQLGQRLTVNSRRWRATTRSRRWWSRGEPEVGRLKVSAWQLACAQLCLVFAATNSSAANVQKLGAKIWGCPKKVHHNLEIHHLPKHVFGSKCPKDSFFGTMPILHHLLKMLAARSNVTHSLCLLQLWGQVLCLGRWSAMWPFQHVLH